LEYVDWAKQVVAGLRSTSPWLEQQFDDAAKRAEALVSPMTSTTAPISAATKQKHYYNDNQDQFHWMSPLMAMAL
jgi:hypothetical protein